jgi:bifunctional DNA-binding transcriptional regulator/antitoxin component of YhaV-PrlF toxin-antitoxin module
MISENHVVGLFPPSVRTPFFPFILDWIILSIMSTSPQESHLEKIQPVAFNRFQDHILVEIKSEKTTLNTRNVIVISGDYMSIGTVGSKGELFPPKELRMQAGLVEGQKVIYHVWNGRLVVERLLSAREILAKPPKVTIAIEELKRDRLELSEGASQ